MKEEGEGRGNAKNKKIGREYTQGHALIHSESVKVWRTWNPGRLRCAQFWDIERCNFSTLLEGIENLNPDQEKKI